MSNSIVKTDFNFPKQSKVYKGKVRDVYTINDELLVMVVSDRISAFDVVLPKGIPFKGQVLNQIAEKFLEATKDIVPNWKIATPDPMVTVGHFCETFPVEMIVRGYLTGSSWRLYKNGGRDICGVPLPEGLKEHQAFPESLLTPTTKAEQGEHDENISRDEIIKQGLVSEEDYVELERISLELFKRGSEIAKEMGLILVDTKYEFGKSLDGEILLIDELHTCDSSRYWLKKTYNERFNNKQEPEKLDKDCVRDWVRTKCDPYNDCIPPLPEDIIIKAYDSYKYFYDTITAQTQE